MEPIVKLSTDSEMAKPKSDADLARIFHAAHTAGLAAGRGETPTPMIVTDELGGYTYEPVMDGACGFAWIVIKPGTSKAAKYAKRYFEGRAGHGGGVHIWVSLFNQSYERKMAYARAFAEVLTRAGIRAYADGRLD